MCCTPRPSGSIKKVHRRSVTRADFKLQAQMMRRASELFDKKQEERAKQQQQKQTKKVHPVSETMYLSVDENTEKTFVERFSQFFDLIRSKIPPIVTT